MSADVETGGEQRSPVWTAHGRKKWHDPHRNDVHDRDPERGWRESVSVDYPSAYGGARGRYHVKGDCILIVKDDHVQGRLRPHVVTVINLPDRSAWEQAYVRYQAVFGGERDV